MKKENVHQSRIISIGKIATKQNSKNDPLLKMNYGIVHHRINSQFFTVNLHSHDHLTREEKYVLANMELEKGIAQNRAVLDNTFSLFVAINNKIPIFIVGKPGCSKSLSVQLINKSMKG